MKNIKPFLLQKIKVKKLKCRLQFLFGTLRVNLRVNLLFIFLMLFGIYLQIGHKYIRTL